MAATNINVNPTRLSPLGGAGSDGSRVVYVSADKAAQNDTVTLTNVKKILAVFPNVTDGTNTVVDTFSVTDATNVITLTGATTGTAHIFAIVR